MSTYKRKTKIAIPAKQTQDVVEVGTVDALKRWLKNNPSARIVALTTSTRKETVGNLVAVFERNN